MDYLRSCYSTKAVFVAGGHESTIRWYWAPDDAKLFLEHTRFGSLNWSKGSSATNQIGEVIGRPRPYSKGETPACATGSSVWGDPRWFRDGAPDYLEEPHGVNDCGLPQACPVLCQPWFDASVDDRALTTPGSPYSWVQTSTGDENTIWFDFATGSAVQAFANEAGACPPGIADTAVSPDLDGFPPVLLVLQSYDAMTRIGVWVWPDDTTGPPGFTLLLTIPEA